MNRPDAKTLEPKEPRLDRWLEHSAIGMAAAVVAFFALNVPYYDFLPFLLVVFVSSQVPDMDSRLHLGHRHPILHSFALPLICSVLFPRNFIVTGFFVGFAAHFLCDLDNPGEGWMLIKAKTGVVVLWASLIITLMLILNADLSQVLKLL